MAKLTMQNPFYEAPGMRAARDAVAAYLQAEKDLEHVSFRKLEKSVAELQGMSDAQIMQIAAELQARVDER